MADGAMVELLRGFFDRPRFHRTLSCGPFSFDVREDIVHAPFKDHDVYGRARDLLSPKEHTHQRAVIMLDNDWSGSPGPEKIREDVGRALKGYWQEFKVIVLDPELEAWLWQENNPHIGKALKCPDYREKLAASGHWPYGQLKPKDPKEALKSLKRYRANTSNAVFGHVAGNISVKNCVDPAFLELQDTLKDWFPEGRL